MSAGNRCDCCGCTCEMCDGGCGVERVVTLYHAGDVLPMDFVGGQNEEGITTLQEVMVTAALLNSGNQCCPIDESDVVVPYCLFRAIGPLELYLYSLVFFFDGAEWILRILSTDFGGAYQAGYYLEVPLGTTAINCVAFDTGEVILPICEVDKPHPIEELTFTITITPPP